MSSAEINDETRGPEPLRLSGGASAFSLIELLVVVILIGIMTALIIPEMRGTYQDALLRSTARKLVDAFGLAGSRAITMGQLHRVRLDRQRHRYLIERNIRDRETGARVPDARDFPGSEGELDARITIEVHKPSEDADPEQTGNSSSVSTTEPQRRDDAISFYADGTADATEIILRDREGFRLGLQINPTTARVRILELGRE
jgi:type II secretion system protein H